MKRNAAVLSILALVCASILWAGWHNFQARMRQHACEMSRLGTQAQLVPIKPGEEDSPESEGIPDLRGMPAPDFNLTSTDGQQLTLASFHGKVVLLNFWAVWCAPCKVEMPWFAEFQQKYAAQGLQVVGIAMDHPSRDEMLKVAGRVGVNYPLLSGDRFVDHAYGGIDYLPETFYISRDGKIIAETSGLGDKSEVEAHILKALAAQ
jgi:peroxiredoxin